MGHADVYSEGDDTIMTVVVRHCAGDMLVEGHSQNAVVVDHRDARVQREGDSVVIADCDDDLTLRVPFSVTLRLGDVDGDLSISRVAGAEIETVASDLALREISTRCSVKTVHGDFTADGAHDLTIGGPVGGDLQVRNAAGLLTVHAVAGDLDLRGGNVRCTVGSVEGDASVSDVTELTLHGSVGGDLQIKGLREGRLELGEVGGDLDLRNLLVPCVVHHVGGDASAADMGDLTLRGTIDGDLALARVRGTLVFEREAIRGDLTIDEISTASRSRGQPTPAHQAPDHDAAQETRRAILQSLHEGEISAEEATLLLAHAG